jgi:hypothetical protein
MMRSDGAVKRSLALALLLTTATRTPLHAAEERPTAVVELFTSQACSTCPPADSYLGELASHPGVLALAFHVDYWNYTGWADPFALKAATERQRSYARQLGLRYVYTPQIVVNGRAEAVGSDRETIAQRIAEEAAPDQAPRIAISVTRDGAGQFVVHIDAGPPVEPATVWLVGFDREHATQITQGENAGRVLKEYQVVRSLREIGTWSGTALHLVLGREAAIGDGGVAVLLQTNHSGRIIGVDSIKLDEAI